jgi:starch synthase
VVRSDEDFSDNMNGMFQEYAQSKRLSQVATDENLQSSYLALYNELAN